MTKKTVKDSDIVEEPKPTSQPKTNFLKRRGVRTFISALSALIIIPALYAGYIYASTPEVIRSPLLEHYHFRMQILVDGKAEDFSTKDYQIGYDKDQCNAQLPEHPIHLHDDKDQFTHIHWEGITGGMVMKFYGWNFIGGTDDNLGYKWDKLTDPKKIPIHGKVLPTKAKGTNYYVYTGDEKGYKERSFEDWTNQDLEEFFGVTSNFPAHELNKQKRSLLDQVFPKAYAHGTEVHNNKPASTEIIEDEAQKLTRINNLLGNVVIFAQADKPSDQQIKDRFNKLVPLSESTCGG